MAKKSKKAQTRVLNEIRNQLVLQAERWGREGFYTPYRMEEMELSQCRRITGELQSERANLEYELYRLESDKNEVKKKLERLNAYMQRAHHVMSRHERMLDRILIGNLAAPLSPEQAREKVFRKPFVSVVMGDN